MRWEIRNYKKGVISILPILIVSIFIVIGVIITISKVNLALINENTKLQSSTSNPSPEPIVNHALITIITRTTNTSRPSVTTRASNQSVIIADYTTREIKQYGYTIYAGVLSDNHQQDYNQYLSQIIPYLADIKFPRALIENSAFLILDNNIKDKGFSVGVGHLVYNLLLSQFITIPDKDGVFGSTPDGREFIIIKSTALPLKFYSVLTHELGHVIWHIMNNQEKAEWARIRGEPVSDPYKKWTSWELSREEDFAEVFKYLYGQYKNNDSSWEIHTAYKTRECKSYYTQEELDKLLLDFNEYYKLMNLSNPCYKNEPPDNQTKDFIQNILSRLL